MNVYKTLEILLRLRNNEIVSAGREEALNTAMRIASKEISQKVIVRGLGQRYCPVCKHGGANGNYCSNCGQHLLHLRNNGE